TTASAVKDAINDDQNTIVEDQFMDTETMLMGQEELEPGHYEKPFEFSLRRGIPSSVQTRSGRVEYKCEAVLSMNGHLNRSVGATFDVRTDLDLILNFLQFYVY